MSAFERFARFGDKIFDTLRHKQAFAVTDDTAIDRDFEPLRGRKYAVIVTFRRSGQAVPSPVWFGVDGRGNAYVKTVRHAGKVKRLRVDSRVLIAPSNARGKPTGPVIRGTGRMLPEDEWAHAGETIARAYRAGRNIIDRVLAGPENAAAYIEITPGRGVASADR